MRCLRANMLWHALLTCSWREWHLLVLRHNAGLLLPMYSLKINYIDFLYTRHHDTPFY